MLLALETTIQEFKESNHKIYTNINKLPEDYIERVIRGNFDHYTPLKNGKEWLYELTTKYQPKTGKLLSNGGDLQLALEEYHNGYFSYLLQEVNGILYQINRSFYGSNLGEDSYNRWGTPDKRKIALPDPLAQAYLHRFSIHPLHYDFDRDKSLVPGIQNWTSIDNYLGEIRKKKKLLPLIEEIFGDAIKDPLYYGLHCFLWQVYDDVHDTLWVKTYGGSDKTIYYVKNNDFNNIMILNNPIEVIDDYCAHTILRKEEPFDFSPFVSKM